MTTEPDLTPLQEAARRRMRRCLPKRQRPRTSPADAVELERQRVETLVFGRDPKPVVELPPRPAGMKKDRWRQECRRIRNEAARVAKVDHPFAAEIALRDAYPRPERGTPQTQHKANRRPPDPIQVLHGAGAIDDLQKRSAEQIAAVAERIGADVAIPIASLEARVDKSRQGDGGFYERLAIVRMEVAYTRWRAAVPCPAVVLDMLVGETVGFSVAARRHHMHHRRARRLLMQALDLWPEFVVAVARELDDATLAALHATILS